ncbi:MAG: hypothetical protein R2705_17995, partial [Ilumatobacteraceae bacterium]
LVEATVDANDLPATLNEALHWAVTEGRVIAVIPPGSPEIPGFAPPDSAYYYVVDVFAVT